MTIGRPLLQVGVFALAFSFWAVALYYKYIDNTKVVVYSDFFSDPISPHDENPLPVNIIFRNESALALNQLEWFIHVSDIHINEFTGAGKVNFVRFLDEVIPSIKPKFVVCTGDLTDAKDPYTLKTYQSESEWQFYRSALSKRGLDAKNYWFDLPGNHDRFNILGSKTLPSLMNVHNGADPTAMEDTWRRNMDYYKIYGVQGDSGYVRTVPSSHGNFTIISLDGTPYPGLSRPFNFFGYLNPLQMTLFESQLSSLKAPIERRIILSHYPLCTLLFSKSDKGTSVRELSEKFTLFLSGHLHNLIAGIGDELYSVIPNSEPPSPAPETHNGAASKTGHNTSSSRRALLDLEVGDLKDHRMFRLGVYKQTEFSFTDFRMPSSPGELYVHIIHPSDHRFTNSNVVYFDNEIQLLVFGPLSHKLVEIVVMVGDSKWSYGGPFTELPLVRLPFNFESMATDMNHHIHLTFYSETITGDVALPKDSNSHEKNLLFQTGHAFRTDGCRIPLKGIGPYLMTCRFSKFFQILYWITWAILLILVYLFPTTLMILKDTSGKELEEPAHRGNIRPVMPIHHQSVIEDLNATLLTLYKSPIFTVPWLAYLFYFPLGPLMFGYFMHSPHSPFFYFYTTGIYHDGIVHGLGDGNVTCDSWQPLVDTWECATFFFISFVLPCYWLIVSKALLLRLKSNKSGNIQIHEDGVGNPLGSSIKRRDSNKRNRGSSEETTTETVGDTGSVSEPLEEAVPIHGVIRTQIVYIYARATLRILIRLLIGIWWLIQGALLVLLGISYGFLTFLFSPGFLWFYIYALFLYYYWVPRKIENKVIVDLASGINHEL